MSSQKRAVVAGETREESLLQETANKEAVMATRIEEHQAELKLARVALGNVHAEIDRLGGLSSQLKKVWFISIHSEDLCIKVMPFGDDSGTCDVCPPQEVEGVEAEKGHMRDDMKEYKVRESRQLQDNSELEEENTSLQKQVSVLRENQVGLSLQPSMFSQPLLPCQFPFRTSKNSYNHSIHILIAK